MPARTGGNGATTAAADEAPNNFLTEDQIRTFEKDGVLVVDGVLSPEQVRAALEGVRHALERRGLCTEPGDPTRLLVDDNDEDAHIDDDTDDDNDDDNDNDERKDSSTIAAAVLPATTSVAVVGRCVAALSSTRGSGGVIDVFYEPFKLAIATNETLFRMTTQLWQSTLLHNDNDHRPTASDGRSADNLPDGDKVKWHPFGPFDPRVGYSYIDRMGYRLPTKLAERLGMPPDGNKSSSSIAKKTNRSLPIQRSLTPHLDCCPEDRFRGRKWRPIQCFVSLTDNLEPDTGGFEAAKGFHHDFDEWARTRPPTLVSRKGGRTVAVPAPCVGAYTHIRPKEDRDVLERVQHIPVRVGSAVFWDHRIPHANAYRHLGDSARCVVYTSFLPDVDVNRRYVQEQLDDLKRGRQPVDTWIQNTIVEPVDESVLEGLTHVQRCLLGLEDWSSVHDDYACHERGRRTD